MTIKMLIYKLFVKNTVGVFTGKYDNSRQISTRRKQ